MSSRANDEVQAVLRQVVADGSELGLQVAAYRNGELVIDAWAGVADPASGKPVDGQSLFWASSTGKGIAATCVHVLAERGKLDYGATVSSYWPAFGANGKGSVTVRHVLSHTAGVPYPPPGFDLASFVDWDRTCAGIAGLPLAWEPGTRTGYHNYTFGFIVGELVRQIDGRHIRQFLQDEICQPLGVDSLFFGVPEAELVRVATRVPDNEFNRPELRKACIPSSGVITNARSLARHYAMLAEGGQLDGVRLLSPDRIRAASELQTDALDEIYHVRVKRGLGYRLGDDTGPGAGPSALGHVGAAMFGYADPEAHFSIGLVKNFHDPTAGWSTGHSVYESIFSSLKSLRASAAKRAGGSPRNSRKECDVQYNVISADNHILEPPTMFVERVPAKFKDQAPRIVRGKDGGDGWSLDGSIPESTIGLPHGLGSVNPGARIRIAPRGLIWDEVRPGNYDGAAHIKDMQSDGIDAAVVYPQMVYRAYTGLQDRELALACLRAFNDWLLDDFCSADPRLLIGMCMIPWEHPMDVLTAELERVLKKGARAIFLPYTMNPPIYAPHWDPMWRLISDASAVASVHLRFGGTRAPDPPLPDGLKKTWISSVNIVMGYFSAIQPLTELIYTGLFERFPTLKFVHAEVDMGWVPFWGAIMDQIVRQHSYWVDWPMTANPSSYIGKNVFVTGLDDVEGFRLAREGNDLIARGAMFSIDYPHEITLFGTTQKVLAGLTDGLDPQVKHAILAGTAVKLYNLEDSAAPHAAQRAAITV